MIWGYPYFWKHPHPLKSRWWFQIFFFCIFIPNLGEDEAIFFNWGPVQPPTGKPQQQLNGMISPDVESDLHRKRWPIAKADWTEEVPVFSRKVARDAHADILIIID